MKRTPLARGTKQLKRSGFKAKSTSTPKKRAMGRLGANKRKSKDLSKGYKPPKWFTRIKPGGHGNTPAQKRLWRVVSETYRQEDIDRWGAFCPCCGKPFETYHDAQLGHWLRYSLCNSWMKFERVNLAAICPGCNYLDDAITLQKLGEALRLRYGEDTLLFIEQENLRMRGKKIETWAIVDYVARLRPDLVE